MQSRHVLLGFSASLIAVGMFVLAAQAQAPIALTGQVSSTAEGAMEGVIVSAKRNGSTVTMSNRDCGRLPTPA